MSIRLGTSSTNYNTTKGYTLQSLGPLAYNSPYTIMGWIYVTLTTVNQAIFCLNDNTNNTVGYSSSGNTKNRDLLTLYNRSDAAAMDIAVYPGVAGGTSSTIISTKPIKLNTWHHVAMVRVSTSSLLVYVDGVQVISNTTSVSSRTIAAARLDVGRDAATGLGVVGRIANVTIWTSALSAPQIVTEKAYGAPSLKTNLYAWYPTRLSAGTVRGNDYGGSSRHMVISTLSGGSVEPGDDVNPTGLVTYPSPLPTPTGGVTFSGTIRRGFSEVLAGSVSFGASTRSTVAKVVTAVLSFGGSLNDSVTKRMGGVLSFGGNVVRRASKKVGGSLSFGGTLTKAQTVLLAAVLSFTALTTQGAQRLLNLAGGLGFNGTIQKQTIRRVIGTLAFAGALTSFRQRLVNLAAGLSFNGSARREITRRIGGGLAFNGRIVRQVKKNVSSAVGFTGALLSGGRSTVVNVGGSLSFISNVTHVTGQAIVVRVVKILGHWKTRFILDGEMSD